MRKAPIAFTVLIFSSVCTWVVWAHGSSSEGSLKSAAKAEAFKKITVEGDRNTTIAEADSSDADIELIKRAAADNAANPQIVRSNPVREATEPRADVAGPARGTASTDGEPEPKAEPRVELHSAVPAAAATKVPAAVSSSSTDDLGVPGEKALLWMQHGNERYVKKHFRKDGRMPADRVRLMKSEHPHAIVLSCSDSRIPPEIIFDQALGEIHVIRVLGEAIDTNVIASVEYALEKLNARLLIVLGHSSCGAVESALTAQEPKDDASASAFDKLLEEIRPRLKTVRSEKPSAGFEVEAALNADGAARELVKRSDIIRKRVDEGRLLIKSGLYRLESGKVSFY